jgi:3-hydroxybutyryl-CoA dehydrogenase
VKGSAAKQDSPLLPLRSVAIIGAGHRGRAFALRCARSGSAVVLEDVLSAKLRKAEAEFNALDSDAAGRVRYATSVEDAVRQADVAVDFVPDELESKLEVFSLMDRMAPPHTVFCTPTALSISDLAACTYRPELCVGFSGFEEELSPRITVVRGTVTAAETVARIRLWLEGLGAVVSVVEEGEHSLAP